MSLGKNNKLGIRFDITCAILVMLVMLLFNYMRYIINYNLGLRNQFIISPGLFMYIILFCFIIALASIIIYIYRLCIHIKVFNELSRKEVIIRILLLLLLPFIYIGEIYYLKHEDNYLCRGFSEKMHREADIPAIQDWLETIDTASLDFKHDFAMIPKNKQPDSIAILSPKSVYIVKYDTNKIRVRLEWGGALPGHWGLVVGSNTMTMSTSDVIGDDVYIRHFAPGAYIWHN